MCRGRCCSLVNDVINILIEYGEIDPDAEVNISVHLYVIVILLCFRTTDRQLLSSV